MRINFQRVLCPVDNSEFSRRALEHATAVARWYDAEVTVLHVLPVLTPITAPPGAAPMPFGPDTRAEAAEDELSRLARPAIDAGVRVQSRVAIGQPVTSILQFADQWPADLLVLGTHGRGGFERLFLGSVTERLLRKAPCPVLTVPRGAETTEEPVQFKRIVCPIDFSEASLAALEYGLSLAREADGCITLVHVVEGIEEEPTVPSSFSVPEYRRHREEEARRRLVGLVPRDAASWCTPATIVAVGKAYREIRRIVEEKKANLVVMGVLGRNPIDLMLFGSTTHHVIREARCPVLTIRPSAA